MTNSTTSISHPTNSVLYTTSEQSAWEVAKIKIHDLWTKAYAYIKAFWECLKEFEFKNFIEIAERCESEKLQKYDQRSTPGNPDTTPETIEPPTITPSITASTQPSDEILYTSQTSLPQTFTLNLSDPDEENEIELESDESDSDLVLHPDIPSSNITCTNQKSQEILKNKNSISNKLYEKIINQNEYPDLGDEYINFVLLGNSENLNRILDELIRDLPNEIPSSDLPEELTEISKTLEKICKYLQSKDNGNFHKTIRRIKSESEECKDQINPCEQQTNEIQKLRITLIETGKKLNLKSDPRILFQFYMTFILANNFWLQLETLNKTINNGSTISSNNILRTPEALSVD